MTNSKGRKTLGALLMLLCAGYARESYAGEGQPAAAAIDPPETVVVTYRAKAGKEKEVEALIQQHWKTIQRLGMVLPEPHLLFRGQDSKGATFFVNIITWKTHDTPDNAPAEVAAIWKSMEESVEKRDCRRGIEFDEVSSVPLSIP